MVNLFSVANCKFGIVFIFEKNILLQKVLFMKLNDDVLCTYKLNKKCLI